MTPTVAAPGRGIELPVSPPAELPDPDLSENAVTVLERRYLVKDDELRPVETARELFWRVARAIGAVDLQYGASGAEALQSAERFYHLMANGEFEPNSPTLMNAGRPLGQLSACFVLPVEDSLEGIYTTLRNMALIHQSGGGTGFGFSRLMKIKGRLCQIFPRNLRDFMEFINIWINFWNLNVKGFTLGFKRVKRIPL